MILGKYSGATYEPVEQPKPQRRPHRKAVEQQKPMCGRCGLKPVHYKALCKPCLAYKRTHGVDRPYNLIKRIETRIKKPHWCSNCGNPEIHKAHRCSACYIFLRRNGKERPEHLWNDEFVCLTCGFPKSAAKHDKRGRLEFKRGRCLLCAKYLQKYKRERPQRLWGSGKFGFCACGYSAEHQVDGFNLCNRCVKEYK